MLTSDFYLGSLHTYFIVGVIDCCNFSLSLRIFKFNVYCGNCYNNNIWCHLLYKVIVDSYYPAYTTTCDKSQLMHTQLANCM